MLNKEMAEALLKDLMKQNSKIMYLEDLLKEMYKTNEAMILAIMEMMQK